MRLIFALLMMLTLSGPALAEDTWSDYLSGIRDFEVSVIRGDDNWQALWADIGRKPPAPLPSDRMAVVVFAGMKPSGGYSVTIQGVDTRGCLAIVRFAETNPQPGTSVIKMLTTPWAVAIVPSSARPVLFERVGAEKRPLLLPAAEGARLAQMAEICTDTPPADNRR